MKKLLLTILFTLVLSENVICKEYSVHSGDYKWSFTKNSKNEDEIKIEVENVSSTQQKIYTNFLIYDNCSSEKKLIDTIDIESQIGKQLSEPFEILDFRIKPSILLTDKNGLCGGLEFKEGLILMVPGDICINEKKKGFIKYQMCKIRNVGWYEEDDKLSRSDAADKCAAKSKSKPSEVRSQYYKDCMKDEGY